MRYSFDKALIECTNTKCKIQPSTWLRVKTDSVNKLVKIWNTRKLEEWWRVSMQLEFDNELLKQNNQKIKSERDTLIDDIAVLKEKNKELKEEMKRLHEESNITVFCALMEENTELNKENEKLMVVSKQYNTLTDHIRLKAEMNPSVSRYIDLVNYIDRLERD